mgnify:CR=1 FL=1
MKKKIFVLCVIATLIFTSFFGGERGINAQTNTLDYCHFGINNPYPFTNDYDMTLLGADSYINWSVAPDPLEPQNYQHIKVIRTWGDINNEKDLRYEQTKANLPAQLSDYPGAIWIIGNEPDTAYESQDNLLAEVYAQRFLELSAIIRANDPLALIGFAPIVQPSPVRIYYLELVITEMNKLLQGTGKTISETFDLWTIHSFLLREGNDGGWGTGLPPGITLGILDSDHQPLLLDIRNDTHSIDLFRELIINFRQWMQDKGLGDKPLWITEYGSLMPYYFVPESETVTYMIETFNFLLSYQDPNIGYAGDENRLVQKWYWYSLNDSISSFGGTLYNRRISEETSVGRNFRQYTAGPAIIGEKAPDFEPISIESISPIRFSEETGKVDYLVIIRVRNQVSADHNSNFDVELFDGDDVLLGSGSGTTVRCAGDGLARIIVTAIPGTLIPNLKIVVSSVGLPDNNSENDSLIIPNETIFDGLPEIVFLPLITN